MIFLSVEQQKFFLQAWRISSVAFHPSVLYAAEVAVILIMECL